MIYTHAEVREVLQRRGIPHTLLRNLLETDTALRASRKSPPEPETPSSTRASRNLICAGCGGYGVTDPDLGEEVCADCNGTGFAE